MDGFLRSGSNDEFSIGYYQEGDLGFIDAAARACTTYDRMFCNVLASTFPNREYMWAAESYGLKDNSTPPQAGYNTGFPDNTIFAALDKIGVSNRYFNVDLPVSALWGAPASKRTAPVTEYYTRCADGTLPALSFVDPGFANADGGTSSDEHPHGDIRVGQAFMSDVVHAFLESPQWPRGALFIVYDEWGGFFDHVRPPRVPDMRNSRDLNQDFGQTGIRIPAVAISPWARRHYVSHTVLTPISILKMISYRRPSCEAGAGGALLKIIPSTFMDPGQGSAGRPARRHAACRRLLADGRPSSTTPRIPARKCSASSWPTISRRSASMP